MNSQRLQGPLRGTKLIFSLVFGMFLIGMVSAGNYVFENTSGTELMKIYGQNGNVSILGDLNVGGDIYGAVYGVWNGSSDYYLKSNPFGFFNSTSLNSLSQLINDLGIGNWTLDKSNYYNSSQVDSAISSANTSIKNYADGAFITKANEGNLNVNSSTYWAGLNSVYGIRGSQINNDLNWVNASTVGGSYYLITNPYGFYNSTTLQNLSQLNDNLGNRGYTSLSNFTNNLNFINSTYNSTYDLTSRDVTANRSIWESTYNATYNTWAYNQTTAAMLIANDTFIKKTGDNGTGEYNFNNGWTNGGLSIRSGDLYAQSLYVYNISSLQVSNLNINGSLLPYNGFDNQFDVGSPSLRWNDAYFGGNLYINGTIYNSNGLPVNGNVTGAGSANRVTFWNGGSSITSEDNLTWDSTNKRLGIGTTSPSYSLHISKSQDSLTRIKLDNDNNGTSAQVGLELDNNVGQSLWTLYSSNYATTALQNTTLFGSGVGGYIFRGYTGSSIKFGIGATTAGMSNALTIDSNSNVGIGTTNPQNTLNVVGTANVTTNLTSPLIYTYKASGGTYWNNGLKVIRDGTPTQYGIINYDGGALRLGAIVEGGGASGEIYFDRHNAGSGTVSTSMVINGTGSVGINTTSPSAKLHVKGDVIIEL